MALFGFNLTLFRMTYMNWPIVKSFGTRYFFLSRVTMSLLSAFSQMTGIRPGYFCRTRSDSAFHLAYKNKVSKKTSTTHGIIILPKVCSFLNENIILYKKRAEVSFFKKDYIAQKQWYICLPHLNLYNTMLGKSMNISQTTLARYTLVIYVWHT